MEEEEFGIKMRDRSVEKIWECVVVDHSDQMREACLGILNMLEREREKEEENPKCFILCLSLSPTYSNIGNDNVWEFGTTIVREEEGEKKKRLPTPPSYLKTHLMVTSHRRKQNV